MELTEQQERAAGPYMVFAESPGGARYTFNVDATNIVDAIFGASRQADDNDRIDLILDTAHGDAIARGEDGQWEQWTTDEGDCDCDPPFRWADRFPAGRGICYEGDDPEGFAAQIKEEFGFDPSADPAWNTTLMNGGYDGSPDGPFEDPFGRTHWFICPPEHLDAIYGSDRFPLGS
jgi:hypothetical protein